MTLILMTACVAGCGSSSQPAVVDDPAPDAEAQPAAGAKPALDLNTYQGVVADIVANLDDESKALLRKTPKRDLIQFHLSWGMGIRNKYRFWSNEALVKSCAKQRGRGDVIHPDDASMIVMEGVWEVVNAQK